MFTFVDKGLSTYILESSGDQSHVITDKGFPGVKEWIQFAFHLVKLTIQEYAMCEFDVKG